MRGHDRQRLSLSDPYGTPFYLPNGSFRYPGYGPRVGTLGEESLVADAQQTITLAHSLYGAPLLLIGESLGAGVVAAAGTRERDKTAGLLLITPWDRLEHVAAYHYPWLPVKWLLRDRYDSVTHLALFGHPVLVVVARTR
jgi:alpha-beta hydrolase superfamily lysophospholipase